MIRTERLSMDTATFAAERRNVFTDAENKIAVGVRYSMIRFGLPRWSEHIISAALEVFDNTARAEVEEWSQILDDMRDAFEVELRRTLEKTTDAADKKQQEATLTRWVSTMAVNAATEAATTADPDTGVGLEWVTMGDPDVRHSHQEANGQTVPTGHEFEVAGEKLLYPGQPVGDPSVWINCRCTVRPTMLTEASSRTITAAADEPTGGDKSVEETKNTSSVLVALPAADDPVNDLGPEQSHVTLLWFGDAEAFDPEPIKAEIAAYAKTFGPEGPVHDAVNGTAVLGKDKANVLLLDATHLANIRGAILATDPVRAVHDGVEQFPTWIPHLTISYPEQIDAEPTDQPFSSDTPPIPESIKFDRLALWHGDEQYEYPIGGTVTVESSEPQETEEEFAAKVAKELAKPVMSAEQIPDGTVITPESFSVAEVLADDDPMAPNAAEDGDEPPMLDDDEADMPVPWHGVLAPEGVPSGDGRQFAADSLTNRELPLPLKIMYADAAGHDGSVICGRIDKIWREDGLIKAEGVFDHSEHGYEAIRQLAEGVLRGVSVDVDQVVAAVDDPADETAGLMEFVAARIAAATLCAIPAFAEAFVALGPWQDIDEEDVETEDMEPAGEFAAGAAPKCSYCEATATKRILHSEGMAYVATCDEHLEQGKEDAAKTTPDGEPDPSNIDSITDYAASTGQFKRVPQKTKDGPGWITNPKPTHRITDYWVDGRGAAKISWGAPGDFNRCRVQLAKYVQNPQWLAGLCANLHYRALGIWPGQEAGKRKAASAGVETTSLTASVSFAPSEQIIVPADVFRNPMLTEETPFTVTEDGRVFGHIATWGVCHIGIGESCVNAPPSETDYAYFLTGKVLTDAGPVAVGQISLGGGHADARFGVRGATAHYDSTSAAVADVTVGEDAFGIWAAGVLRPGVTAEDVYALRAAVLSGDWREVIVNGKSNLELVAALAVNVPGYPIPRPSLAASAEGQSTLIAAAIAVGDKPRIDSATIAKVSEARQTIKQFRVQNARKALANGKG